MALTRSVVSKTFLTLLFFTKRIVTGLESPFIPLTVVDIKKLCILFSPLDYSKIFKRNIIFINSYFIFFNLLLNVHRIIYVFLGKGLLMFEGNLKNKNIEKLLSDK